MKFREFHNAARTGKTRVWRIAVEGDQVLTEFGDLDGKLQQVSDTAKPKNEGRSNFISGEQAAIQQMERQVLLKERTGYREIGGAGTTVRQANEISWDQPLPHNLSFYKPENALSARLLKMLEKDEAWLSRKRDGEMMVIVKGPDGLVDIYSRKMLLSHDKEQDTDWTWSHRFAHIAEEAEENDDIPNCSILLGDIVGGPKKENRWYVGSVMKSLTPRAIELQAKQGELYYYCWDIAFWGGEDLVSTTAVCERYRIIDEVFKDTKYILPVVFYMSGDIARTYSAEKVQGYASYNKDMGHAWNAACAYALDFDWEGFVVVDPQGEYGDKAYNFRGKTDRPGHSCGKLKPEYELDAVLLWDPENGVGEYGTGKHQGKVGSVALYQYDGEGNLVYLCDCGGGFDDGFRDQYSDPRKYPLAAEIKYTNRAFISEGDKTNALQFPRFVRVRHDKELEECVEERLNGTKG